MHTAISTNWTTSKTKLKLNFDFSRGKLLFECCTRALLYRMAGCLQSDFYNLVVWIGLALNYTPYLQQAILGVNYQFSKLWHQNLSQNQNWVQLPSCIVPRKCMGVHLKYVVVIDQVKFLYIWVLLVLFCLILNFGML